MALFDLTEFEPKSMQLIYRSSIDGSSAFSFHRKCDKVQNTLTLIKPQNTDYIFGGYTSQTWSGDGTKLDPYAFLISLNNPKKIPFKADKNLPDTNAIHTIPKYGPCFGKEDIYIFNEEEKLGNSFKIKLNRSDISFKYPPDFTLADKNEYTVSEIEVFEIIK